MSGTIAPSKELRTEQNKIEIPTTVLSGIQNLIQEDRFNLFKIKSKLQTERRIKETENDISTLLGIKKKASQKEKELEAVFLKLKKENSQIVNELKKSLNI